MNRRDQILEEIKLVPSLPASATEAVSIVRDPNASLTELEAIIECDAGLATNILRLANSAYFGGRGSISTVKDATVRLGTKRIVQLVLTTAVAPRIKPPLAGYDMPSGALLAHSVAAAVGAEQLAQELRLAAPDYTYTAGLLHDIGKIVLGTYLNVEAKPILDLAFGEGVSFEEAERQVLGIDHAEVGAELLTWWRLPDDVVRVVRYHHDPYAIADGDGDGIVTDLVHVGDHIGRLCGTALGADGVNYSVSPRSVERLALTPEITESVVGKVLGTLAELGEFFLQTESV
ncbi:MAG: HDOD domain-containing protein [Candidatus Hydrogenedentes bacterium]|nr:HDOD domain-containing protein [Candidatus Hydrogenedentota bacterium]